MTERLRTTLMIAAILLASAVVTATTWAGLKLVTSSGHTEQRSARTTEPARPIQAKLMPFREPVHAVPAVPRRNR